MPLRKNTRLYRKKMEYPNKPKTRTQKEKAKFRNTKEWKDFRQRLKKERKVDFVTGNPLYAGFQLHHADLNPDHYRNLIPDNYYTLSRTSHEVVHWLHRYPNWEDLLTRLAIILRKMDELNPPPPDPQQKLFD